MNTKHKRRPDTTWPSVGDAELAAIFRDIFHLLRPVVELRALAGDMAISAAAIWRQIEGAAQDVASRHCLKRPAHTAERCRLASEIVDLVKGHDLSGQCRSLKGSTQRASLLDARTCAHRSEPVRRDFAPSSALARTAFA